jgi:hypothetical protein
MNAIEKVANSERYARCVQTSKRVRWDIEEEAAASTPPISSFRTGFP